MGENASRMVSSSSHSLSIISICGPTDADLLESSCTNQYCIDLNVYNTTNCLYRIGSESDSWSHFKSAYVDYLCLCGSLI